MDCNICNEHTKTVCVSLACSCMYTTCDTCFLRMKGPDDRRLCPICKACAERYATLPADVMSKLDKEVVPGSEKAMNEYDVLFTDRHKDVYDVVRGYLAEKWSRVSDYRHQHECQVCKLKYGRFDCPLVELFFACSTLTRVTVLDCMTTLFMLYGTGVCANLTPQDIYFHFFLYHCATIKNPMCKNNDINHKAANFIGTVSDSILYYCPNMDDIASFITNIPADAYGTCLCDASKNVIATLHEKQQSARQTKGNDSEDDNRLLIPVTTVGNSDDESTRTTRCWNNQYKWNGDDIPNTSTPEDISGADGDTSDKADSAGGEVCVNCFQAYSDCPVCTDMMSPQKYPFLAEFNTRLLKAMDFVNVQTAVERVGDEMSCGAKMKADLKVHYTSTSCMLNRIRHIDFYSLTKDPQCLRTPAATNHLFQTIFRNKSSFLCPLSHLAAVSEVIADGDTSANKKTKRDNVKRWVTKILNRHNPLRRDQQKRKR